MSVHFESFSRSGRTMADAGRLLQWGTHAVHPATSALGRIAAGVYAAQLGARLIPAAGRLLRRHPVASSLVLVGFLGALYLAREQEGRSPRLRYG